MKKKKVKIKMNRPNKTQIDYKKANDLEKEKKGYLEKIEENRRLLRKDPNNTELKSEIWELKRKLEELDEELRTIYNMKQEWFKKRSFRHCRIKWADLPLEQKLLYDHIAEALTRLSILNHKPEQLRGYNIFIGKCQHDRDQLARWLGLNDY